LNIAVWLFFFVAAISLGILALYGLLGLSALGLFVAFPNFVALLLSGSIILICCLFRPKFRAMNRSEFIVIISGYVGVVAVILWSGLPFGSYDLRIQIVTSGNNPVPNIYFAALGQKTGNSVMDVFVPMDLKYSGLTAADGTAVIRVSKYQYVGGLVNSDSIRTGQHDERYRFATFHVAPTSGGRVTEGISWSREEGKSDNANMRWFSFGEVKPGSSILHVFLPKIGGSDKFAAH
jgi:hypothetical protein